jgi:hypothetical protein
LPRFLLWTYVQDMPDLWSISWSAGPTGYRVLVCNRCRIAHKFFAETLSGESPAEVRMQAAAKAVELALEYRVPLECVREERKALP